MTKHQKNNTKNTKPKERIEQTNPKADFYLFFVVAVFFGFFLFSSSNYLEQCPSLFE